MKNNRENIKKLAFTSIVLLVINSIIGAGIFLTPDDVIKQAGQYTPIAYLFAAIFAIVLGVTFASAAKYVQKNGAAYAYTEAAFSPYKKTKYLGQYVGITRWVTASIAWGTAAAFFVTTLVRIFNPAAALSSNPYQIPLFTILFILFLAILLVINLFGNKIVEIVSNSATITKVSALIIFVVVSVIAVIGLMSSGNSAQLSTNYNSANVKAEGFGEVVALIFAATIPALYAYTGFESVASASEEMENPQKNLPRALVIGLFVVALIYISTVTFGMLMGSGKIVNSKESIKLLAVIENDIVKALITFGAIVSIFGLNVAASFGSPRILSALADNKQVPAVLGKKLNNGVPINAFIATALAAMVFPIALLFNTAAIAQLSVISRFIQFILVPISVMILAQRALKSKNTEERKLYSKFNDMIIPVLALILVAILLVNNNWNALFKLRNAAGEYVDINYVAIGSLILLFLVLPATMIVLRIKGVFKK